MEEYRNIKGYDGMYQVSNMGNVRSLKGLTPRILKPIISKGYARVSLWKSNTMISKSIHQIVAAEFLNHRETGRELVPNHINFNKLDNRAENLEIVTARENLNRKHLKSTSKYVGVHWNKSNKKWRGRIVVNGAKEHLGYFENELDAHSAYQKRLSELI